MLLYRKRVTIYTYSTNSNLDPVINVLASQSCVHAPHRNIKVNNLATVHTIIVAHKFRSQNWSITAQCKTKRHHYGLARSRQYLVVERYFNVGCSCGVLRWRLHATYCRFQLTTQSTHGDAHLNSSKRVGRAAYQLHSSLQ